MDTGLQALRCPTSESWLGSIRMDSSFSRGSRQSFYRYVPLRQHACHYLVADLPTALRLPDPDVLALAAG